MVGHQIITLSSVLVRFTIVVFAITFFNQLSAQPIQLSGMSPETERIDPFFGADPTFTESTDGRFLVYFATTAEFGLQLFSVSTAGGMPSVQLSSVATGGAFNFKVSPDSKRVVFRSIEGYFSVPIEGGTPIKLNTSFQSDLGFEISPDSQTVVINNLSRLWSIPILGGENINITLGQPSSTTDISFFKISPDNKFVVYSVFELVDGFLSTPFLLRASIDGSQSVLNLLEQTDDIESTGLFQFSPDSQYIIYEPTILSELKRVLNSVSINGGVSNRLSGVPAGEGGASVLALSSDSSLVYFAFGDLIGQNNRVFSVPVKGGIPSELVNTGSDLLGVVRVLGNEREIVYTSRNPVSGNLIIAIADITSSAQDVVLASIDSIREISSIDFNQRETRMALVTSRASATFGIFDHIVTSVNLIDRTSETILEQQTSNQSLFFNIGGGVHVDENGDNIMLADGLSDDFTARIKAISTTSGEARLLSDSIDEGEVIFNYNISQDRRSIIYVAAPRSNTSDTNLFIVEIGQPAEQVEEMDFCIPIRTKEGSTAVICL